MNSGSQAPPTRSNILGNAGETNHFFAIPVPGRRQRFDFLRQERMLGTNRDDYFHNVDSGIRIGSATLTASRSVRLHRATF